MKSHIFEHTCAYARWAPMHRFLSVCLSDVTLPEFMTTLPQKRNSLENISYPRLQVYESVLTI